MTTTQSSLLIRLRTRDDSNAWSRFVKLYTPLIHHWVSRLGIESNHVNDLVQEVFVVLLGKVSWMALNPPDSFRGWLRTVTLNKCRDYFRRQKRAVEPELLKKIEVNQKDPADLFTEQEYRAFVSRAALQLMQDAFSETTWKACWSSVVEGRAAREIALELGVSENAVYLARGRVLKRLREELEGLWE